ncbi:hypothetical protein Sipo8835_25720 [Streptomyces ipomoeae]|jgi:uncharacterized membrane protein|uniref:Tat pathway signal sequence domain protein n=2 Tax=Streptomyces ipomoeae TaxID=103232 RepID=L1KMM8_9ACTN|nr:hypothetical protein [Streptomyces ipomoeae]EKX61842.1 hypothetical protein STRIP9103_05182 [Streptomyces ipomoeae 91-03]MDX2701150.1 hypothetical protein [Streptomyces ipomoeae]MDX2828813.1 hypothetical protein [Streptomyces ipomoeae]MDX2846793.1 hypothetical protein [Streptomyces ipomoeae]MDX2879341.1 hypothetical protein [Streptomyces ipomoeae]
MRDLRRKLTIATLAAASVFGGLAMPGTASAATANVQLRICDDKGTGLKFYIVGKNDHGDWGGSRFWDVPARGCTTAADYWWESNRSVEFHWVRPGTGWSWKQLYIPKSKNGSTKEFRIS